MGQQSNGSGVVGIHTVFLERNRIKFLGCGSQLQFEQLRAIHHRIGFCYGTRIGKDAMSVPRMQQNDRSSLSYQWPRLLEWQGNFVDVATAEPNTVIQFERVDIPDRHVLLHCENREETPLRTRLINNDCSVEMVEHVMAALHGMIIDNCLCPMHIQRDASTGWKALGLGYAVAIEQAGVVEQAIACRRVVIRDSIRIGDKDQWIMALPLQHPASSASIDWIMDRNRPFQVARIKQR